MTSVMPRHVICVLGKWSNLDIVDAIIHRTGVPGFQLDREFSQLAPDMRMMTAYEASYERVRPTMTEEDWQAIRDHTAVAYVLSPPMRKEEAIDISGLALVLTAALLHAGGLAAKGESSGIAHGRDQWFRFAEEFARAKRQGDAFAADAILYWTWVRKPLQNKLVYYSCGMHLLGERDVEIERTIDLETALEWMDLFGLYLVGDRPTRPLKDGDGFRLHNDGPRRVMRFRPCDRYEQDDFTFNPLGYVRLEQES